MSRTRPLPGHGGWPRVTAAAPSRLWPRYAIYGLLWALVVTSLETLTLPFAADMSVLQLLRSMFGIVLIWGPVGVMLALTVLAVPRLRPARLLLGSVVAPLCISSLTVSVYASPLRDVVWFNQSWQSLNLNADVVTLMSYNLWCSLFYGAPFVWACAIGLRRDRNRATLGEAELARSRTLALLSSVQLRALQGRVDPALLLRTLAVVEQRYASGSAQADPLLDRLVAFLRAAMPAVRQQRASLRSELQMLDAYAQLHSALGDTALQWCLRCELPAQDVVFAPMLLPLLLDRLLAHARTRSAQPAVPLAVALDVRHGTQRVELRLHCDAVDADWLAAADAQRLRQALAAQFVQDWRLGISPEPGVALWLECPLIFFSTQEVHRESSNTVACVH